MLHNYYTYYNVSIIITEMTHNIHLLYIAVTLECQVTTSIFRLQEPSLKLLLFPVVLISGFVMSLLESQILSCYLLAEVLSSPTLQLPLI